MKRDESVYLQHILDAITKVETYLRGIDESAFYRNPLIQDGVIRQIEVLGEATKHLSEELRHQSPQLPWEDIAGMRDKLIHGYFGVDLEKVWLTAIDDLPVFKEEIKKILSNFSV